MKAYSLKKRKDTAEFHLFEGEFLSDKTKCNTHLTKKSVCKEMNQNESEKNIFVCQDENQARLHCAEKGREVCGTCVSHLYTTYY